MTCEFRYDDGAYVLGALSPAERARYEQHLPTCAGCREAVADMAPLPGLLGRLEPGDFARLLEERDPDAGASPSAGTEQRTADLVRAVQTARRTDRRRTRARAAVATLVALVVAALVGLGGYRWAAGRDDPATRPAVAMMPVERTVPITATVALTGTDGGTRVDLRCVYQRGAGTADTFTVRLMAYGPDDEMEQLGSWVAAPGREFTMAGVTHFTAGTLSRLVLTRNDGTALLTHDVA